MGSAHACIILYQPPVWGFGGRLSASSDFCWWRHAPLPVVQLLGVETLFHKSTARPQDDCVGDAMMPEKHVSCRSYRNLLKKIPEMETARPHFKHNMQLPQGRSLSGIMRFQISSLLLLNVCSSSADLLDPLHTLVALRGSCSLGPCP